MQPLSPFHGAYRNNSHDPQHFTWYQRYREIRQRYREIRPFLFSREINIQINHCRMTKSSKVKEQSMKNWGMVNSALNLGDMAQIYHSRGLS